ncbi:hypothetical protein OG264_18850 [Streptomyces xanthophaeus]|uniref:hypothetical protein n=1 Tax=Streptomyces xanthophaeus TaxID=67385 RepID=UPI00386AF1AA|nr:hypothetical protein OG264_18850 [Streptomyces xanthophaeus]WST61646.1 hypothetical protein OG605_19585 [Streptomyces xanthophaeus]
MRVLLHEMRRGEAGKVALLTAVAGVWYLASEDAATSDWIGWWNQASIKVQVFGVIVTGSLMSAAAAWTAGRAHRTRTRTWADTAPRGGWSQALLLWAAAWLWALAGYALMTAVAFWRTAGVSEVTEPVWTPLLLGAVMIAFQIAAGVAAGTLLPSRITAPAMGVLWYLAFVVFAFVPESPVGNLFPAIDEHWDATFRPHTTRLLVATAWCGAAALALLALPALVRRPVVAPRLFAVLPVALAAAVAGGVLLTYRAPAPDPFWALRTPQPAEPACVTEGRTKACLWPSDRHLMPQVEAATRKVDQALGPLTGLNRSFYQTGLRPSGPHSTELPVYRPVVDTATLTSAMLDAALPQPAPGCEPFPLAELGGLPDTFLFQAVIHSRAQAGVPYYGEEFAATLEGVLKAPQADRDAWISAAAGEIGACRPVPPLPR